MYHRAMFGLCVLFLSLVCHSAALGHTARIDSLHQAWADLSLHDTVRVNALLNNVRSTVLRSSPTDARALIREAAAVAEAGSHLRLLAEAINLEGISYDLQGNYAQALASYKRSLELRRSLGLDADVAKSLNNIGLAFRELGNMQEAIDHLSQSIEIKEKLGDSIGKAKSLESMALIFRDRGDHAGAVKLFVKGMAIKRSAGDLSGVSNSLTNIANTHYHQGDYRLAIRYHMEAQDIRLSIGDLHGVAHSFNNIGSTFGRMGVMDSALSALGEARETFIRIGDRKGMAQVAQNIGEINAMMGDHANAIKQFRESLAIKMAINDQRGMFHSMGGIGRSLAEAGRHAEAIDHLARALAMARETQNAQGIQEMARLLSASHSAVGNYREALEMYMEHVTMKDSIRNEENQRALMRQQMQFDYEEKEARLLLEQERREAMAREELNRQRSQRNAMAVIFIALFVSAGAGGVYQHQRRKVEYRFKAMRSELKALQAQMRPHFVFNMLNSINTSIELNEPDKASEQLIRFAKHMRSTLTGSLNERVPLRVELEMWRNYLELERPNLKHGFTFSISVGEDIDIEKTALPPMLVQPLLENAVWHGLALKRAPGHVMVQVKREGVLLSISVTDDGIGRNDSAHRTDRHPGQESVGTELIQERIVLMTATKDAVPSLQLTDLEPGLRAELRIPV